MVLLHCGRVGRRRVFIQKAHISSVGFLFLYPSLPAPIPFSSILSSIFCLYGIQRELPYALRRSHL